MNPLLSDNRPVIGDTRPSEASQGIRPHLNPSTGLPHAEVLVCGALEIDRAAAAAVAGQKIWASMGGPARRDCLFKLAELVEANATTLAEMVALECGTPIAQAQPRIALSWLRYYAGWADKIDGTVSEPVGVRGLAYARHEPIGVIGVIIPWNSPLTAAAMTVVPALAAGNSVILKPPTQTPFTAIKFGELALEAGIPPGAFNVVPGDAEAGNALIAHPAVGKISFTGGESVAKLVMQNAAQYLKPVALELGGKSANIVFADADLEAAAQMGTVNSLARLAGQGCVLPTRLFVQDAIFDEFVDRVHAIASTFTMGDPLDPQTVVGPVINEQSAARIQGVIERAKQESGGRLLIGGFRAGGDLSGGYFIEPTVFADVAYDSNVAREEVFGPVLAIMRFSDEADAVSKANGSRFGLGAYVHTPDLGRAHRMAEALEVGAVSINGMLTMGPNLPFGGYKKSGFGREGGRAGLEEFMQIKQTLIHL